jgi:hypothetical protein
MLLPTNLPHTLDDQRPCSLKLIAYVYSLQFIVLHSGYAWHQDLVYCLSTKEKLHLACLGCLRRGLSFNVIFIFIWNVERSQEPHKGVIFPRDLVHLASRGLYEQGGFLLCARTTLHK